MDDPNITIEEYIRLEEEKAHRRGKVYNWETATYGKIWYDKDVYDLRSVETEFPAIVFNDSLTSKVTLSCEPMVSPLRSVDNVVACIFNTVRLKLVSFTWKKSRAVLDIMKLWKIESIRLQD
ncbi:hypothetical protein Tco_1106638 [Tanacetum coccineum]